MNLVILTPVRLLADGLKECLNSREDSSAITVVETCSSLRETLTTAQINLVLIDITQGVDWDELEKLKVYFPHVALWALGFEQQLSDLKYQRHDIFSGYISRSDSLDALYQAITGSTESRACPHNNGTSSFFQRINPFRRKNTASTKDM